MDTETNDVTRTIHKFSRNIGDAGNAFADAMHGKKPQKSNYENRSTDHNEHNSVYSPHFINLMHRGRLSHGFRNIPPATTTPLPISTTTIQSEQKTNHYSEKKYNSENNRRHSINQKTAKSGKMWKNKLKEDRRHSKSKTTTEKTTMNRTTSKYALYNTNSALNPLHRYQ